jgi:DNA-binding PadR family transcriptional regulator
MSRRSGILEFAVLGLLRESPMHGYELRKRLNTSLGVFRAFSYGSLYPCLKTLVANGWLIEEPGNASEEAAAATLAGRRAKIVYRLTAEGKERFEELLSHTGPDAWEDEHFGVRFAFFGQTSRDVRMRVLEGRRSRLEERLAKMRAALARTRERLDDYTLELQRHMGSVRVAIVGVGNCASSLVQGVEYYKDADPDDPRARSDARAVRRLPRPRRRVRRRVRRGRQEGRLDLAEAIVASENNTIKICDVPPTGVTVQRGHTFDGLGKYYRETIDRVRRRAGRRRPGAARRRRSTCSSPTCRWAPRRPTSSTPSARSTPGRLRQRAAGLHRLRPGVGKKFTDAGVPIVGDDIKSQVGATITHRVLAKLFEDRGVELLTAPTSSTSAATWTS